MKRKFNPSVHAWEINGFVNIKKKFKDTIKNYLFLKNKSYQKTSRMIGKISGASISDFLRNKDSFMKISNFFRLTNSLEIPKNVVETKIISYRDHNAQPKFKICFPYQFSPIILRIISYIPGDGSIRKNGFARWTQKDTTQMQHLLKKLEIPIKSTKSKSLTLPRFLIKVSCVALGLKPEEISSPRFVERVINLPRLYKVQPILALIEDEATINAKNHGTINIRLTNKDLIKLYAKLCDSLGYKRSDITERKNTGFVTESKIYKLKILAEGIRKLNRDYDLIINKFGNIGGLWKKDTAFRKRCKKALSEKALKDKEGRKITKEVLKLFAIYNELSVKRICKLMNTKDYDRIYDKIRYLHEIKKIKRTSYGEYALVKTL